MANLLAPSSNSSGHNSPFEIFINHRGPDTKSTIASHIYNRLHDLHGLRVFLDKEEMEKGHFLKSQIAAAIRDASVQIAIFSPRYAESEWCLNELLLMLESMESGRSAIIPIFCGVQPADLRWTLGKDGVYAKALTKLQKKKTTDSQRHRKKPRYESDTIEKWRNALSTVSLISGFDLQGAYNGVEWRLVDEVVQLVLEKVKKPQLDVSKYPTGLDQKVKEFEELLHQQNGGTKVIGIVGLGGVGKTTLSKEIFNRLRSNYKKSCFLFDVRERSRNSLHSLQSMLIKDLTGSNVQISSTDEGQEKLRRYLSSSQALIILDDVDHIKQLDALLLPAKAVLHTSSLILVTSRNKDVLISSDIPESSIYSLTGLNPQHSQELFCSHAFGQPQPVVGFDKVVEKFLGACHGLPLSLKVLGALLHGEKDLNHWEAQLRKMSKILPEDIQSTLKISYDSLDKEERQIFLDIACFFIGETTDTVIRVWDESGWEGSLGLQKLENKCLVEVVKVNDSKNCIRMHDHLRDLGRHIGKKESPRRLWSLTDNILHDLPERFTVRGINMVETSVDNRAELGNHFPGMRGLQLIRAEGDCLDESIFTNLRSRHLIWFRWDRCPFSCLPRWIPMEHIRVLHVAGSTTLKALWEDHNLQVKSLPDSFGNLTELQHINVSACYNLERLPESFGELKNLQHINLSYCNKLERLPDSFGELKSLQHINLSKCCGLKRLPDSFGELKSLQHINLSYCERLERLPDSFGELKSLQHINLSWCNKLERLPDSFGELKSLQHINLSKCCGLKRLPDSFGELKSLQHINLSYCERLERLPDSFGELKSLQHINLSWCNKLERLPDSFGELKSLQHINLSKCCGLKRLPDSFGELKSLQHINLSYCERLERLPDSFGEFKSLQYINLFLCWKLERLPDSFGELKSLQHINLSFCYKLERLPDSFYNLIQLQHLELSHCNKLNILPETFGRISTLKFLRLSFCPKIKVCPPQLAHNRLLLKLFLSGTNLTELPSHIGELSNLQVLHLGSEWLEILPPSLGHLRCLQELVLSNCRRLKCLPDNIRYLSSLQKLELSGCIQLKCLPDSIGSLTRLRDFKIEKSGVEYLPACVTELNRLERLEIEDCPLSQLPFRKVERGPVSNKLDASIVECMLQLKYLKLFCIEISEVSFSEGVCPNLQHLDIYRCGFLAEVGALPTTLTKLKLSECCALGKIRGLCALQKLEEIQLVGCYKLEELPGVETLICLHQFIVNCHNLKSIEGLGQLSGLGELNVANCCELKEIPGLEHLNSLKKLNASECWKLQSIERLGQMTGLREINVANCCKLKEIPGLEHLNSLMELNASGCVKLQSIEGLGQLSGLGELNVANCCELKEIPGLEHLNSLKKLNASGCVKLQSIEGLGQLSGLGELNVANCCELKEIPGLEHLNSLKKLNASGCLKLLSIEGLAQLTRIQVLNVANCCELKEIPGLEHLNSLKKLNISGCRKLQSIEGLGQLTGLTELNMANCSELWMLNASGCGKLLSTEWLAQLTCLRVLNVANWCELEEIPGLEHLKWLLELNASGCGKLRSIEGLAQLTQLGVLNVEDCCELKEIPSLEHLKWLTMLNASGCGKLQGIEGLAQLSLLRVLNVANCCELKELPGLEHLISLRKLNAGRCPKLQSRGGLAQLTKLEMLNVVDCRELEELPGLEHLRLLRVLNTKHFGKLQLRGGGRVWKYLGQRRKKGKQGVALGKPVRRPWKKETLQNEMSKAIIAVRVLHYYNVGQ